MASEFQKTASSAGLIGLAAFIGALVGFVLQLIVAYYFGASEATDAYFMAQSTSEMLSKLLLGGSIASIFIPLFVERLTRGKREEAWYMALNLFHLVSALYIVLIIVLGFFAEPFVQFIAPGFAPETTRLTVTILRVVLPSFFFLFLVDLVTAMLHSLRIFSIPALLRIVAPTITIISVVTLVSTLGIFSLAVGTVVGSIVQFCIVAWTLKKQGFSYRFVFDPKDANIRHLLHLVYPFLFSVLVTQGAGIVYRVLVSELEPGSLAALKFAEKITQLLTLMFLTSVTMVIYPLLSQKAAEGDRVGIKDTIASSFRLIFFTLWPIVLGVVLLREPLISVLYQRGSFTAEDALQTSIALLFLVFTLLTNGISSVLGHAILALKETRAAVAITICSQAVAISLFVLLVPLMGLGGLALASSLVPLAAGFLYFLYLTRYIPRLHTVFFHSTFAKSLVLGGALYIAVIFLVNILQQLNILNSWLLLIVPTLTGAAVYIGGAYLWRIPEMHELLQIMQNKRNKWFKKQPTSLT